MGVAKKLKHADGTAITAQEAYDAFMNTRVLIVDRENTHEAIRMVWYDTNSAQADPTNVGFVSLKYIFEGADGTVSLATVNVGDFSLVPSAK